MNQTRSVPCDLHPTDRKTQVPIGAERESDAEDPTTAVEAIRCLFLSRELRQLGHAHAADRWQAKAAAWLQHLAGTSED